MSKIICDIRFIKSWSYCGTNVITTRIISTDTGSFNKAPDSKKAIIKDAKAMAEAIQKESSRKKPKKYDVVIVGGGIVGVATARELSNRSCNLKMAILEKEKQLAGHQSGRNSGVIHAGIYYVPGSLKAKLCTEGMRMAYDYLDCKKIPYKKCGKLIIATNPYEVCLLDKLEKRGKLNNVPGLKRLKCLAEIQKIEPLAQGLEALWSPETGIVDWGLVTKYLAEDFKTRNGQVHLGFEVNNFCESNDAEYPVKITSVCGEEVQSKFVLTCAGLYSDRLAVMSGCSPDPKIIPFRGEYYTLKPAKACKFQKNIYPVPDPSYPFLGLHVTPRVDGNVWLGPNAILAFKREGYSFKDYSMKEIMETVFYPGFIRFSLRYLIPGVRELYRSQNIQRQLKQLQKMVPSITLADIETPNPTEPVSGVRAQAMDSKGNLIDDFVFDINKTGGTPISCRILHCRNAPSPGATSSMAIGKHIAEMFEKEFGELHEIEKDRQRKVDEELRATQARMVQKPNP